MPGRPGSVTKDAKEDFRKLEMPVLEMRRAAKMAGPKGRRAAAQPDPSLTMFCCVLYLI